MKQKFCICLLFVLGLFSANAQTAIRLKTLAIGDFEYMGAPSLKEHFRPFEIMLKSDLVKTKKFQLVERSKIDQAMKEQGLSDTGFVGRNAKQIGHLVGADYVVYGSITDIQQQTSSAGNENRFTITLDLNILDSETGEIKLAENVEYVGHGTVRHVMRSSVGILCKKIIMGIYPVSVAASKNGVLYLNYGRDFISSGDVFDIFTVGDVIVDPATGLVLANEEELLGQIQVSSTLAKFSKASVIHSEGEIVVGMVCRVSSTKPQSTVDGNSSDSSPQHGPLKIVVGQFVYSEEFDLSQNRDRSRSVNTSPTTSGGGLLGLASKVLIGDNVLQQPHARHSSSSSSPADSSKTAHVLKSDTLREMVVTRLTKTGQFQVLERSRLGEIQKEIDMMSSGMDGYVSKDNLSKINLKGADYLIYGTITRLSSDIHNTTTFGRENTVMLDMTIELRIVDLKTGQIISADEVSSSVETSKKGINFLGLIGTSKEQGGVMGDLLSLSGYNVVTKITTALRPITVVDVDSSDGSVTVNYGESIINMDMDYEVFSQGKTIKDPYSGRILGKREIKIGVLRPVRVSTKFSKLQIVKGSGNVGELRVGMVCRPCPRGNFRSNTVSREYRSRSTGSSHNRRKVAF